MMEQMMKGILDGVAQALMIGLASLVGLAIQKIREFFKSKLTEKQYDLMSRVAYDVYEYIEHEYGMKAGASGETKLQFGMELFDKQMKKLGLPYTAEDFKLQVEKIIRQEKVQG